MEHKLLEFERAIKQEGVQKYLLKLFALAGLYIIMAKIGLSLAFTFDHITTIWPPTGISITALLLLGYHYWPGIFVGAFIANAISDATAPIAAAIAVGNTLEAVVAVMLIKRFILQEGILERITSVLAFVVLVPLLSTMVSATIGVVSLMLGGIISRGETMEAWFTWWVGDMMGALVIVPLVIAWHTRRYRRQLVGHAYEGVALFLLVVMAGLIIFSQPADATDMIFPLIYLVFPLVMLASVRFTQIGAVTAGTIIALAALWGTLSDTGPYAPNGSIEHSIFSLHFFILVVMVTALVLSVAVYGRLRSEQALAKQAHELEQARQQMMQNIEWRKTLEEQVEEASEKINSILDGIFESNKPKRPPRPKV